MDGEAWEAPDSDFASLAPLPEADAPEGGRIVSEWDGSRYDFWGHVYAPDTFDGHEQLLALRRQAYRRFYLRPRYLRRRLGRMVRSGEAIPQLRRAARGGLLALRLAVGQRPSA